MTGRDPNGDDLNPEPADLDELDAKVLEDLDVDEGADDVQGGAFTDDCLTRN